MELNRIYCENCLDTMARMPDGFVDLTVTSPPYDNLRKYNGYSFDFEAIAQELFRVTKEGGVVVWIVGDETKKFSESLTSFKQALYFKEQCGFLCNDTMIYRRQGKFPEIKRYWQDFEFMFVFCKGSPKTFNPIKEKTKTPAGSKLSRSTERMTDGRLIPSNCARNPVYITGTKSKGNIWEYSAGYLRSSPDETAFEHPAIFPEQLAADHIYSWSNEGDLVYDPFMGSGTTAKMAHIQKRNWIGSEISPEYVALAEKRLEPYLNQYCLF